MKKIIAKIIGYIGFCISISALAIETSAEYALLIDLSTDSVLFEKNADKKMYPSSMTKILTAYMIFDALKHGLLQMGNSFVVSEYAAKREGSAMLLETGKSIPLSDLILGVIVSSGNDACSVVAEGMAGSEPAFATQMTEKARELGASHSNFVNASGLPDENHFTTCYDLAAISKRLLSDFPDEYKKYFGLSEFMFGKIHHKSMAKPLLSAGIADGIKTGKTEIAKYGMVASSKRGDRRLLLVVNGMETAIKRINEVKNLLEFGFSSFKTVSVFEKGAEVIKIPVWHAREIAGVVCEKVAVSLPINVRGDVTVFAKYLSPMIPPVKKGQRIGKIIMSANGFKKEFDIVAKEDVPVPSFFEWIMSWF